MTTEPLEFSTENVLALLRGLVDEIEQGSVNLELQETIFDRLVGEIDPMAMECVVLGWFMKNYMQTMYPGGVAIETGPESDENVTSNNNSSNNFDTIERY